MAVIPPRTNRREEIECDMEMYKWRHLVENFFCRLKHFPVHHYEVREDRRKLPEHDLRSCLLLDACMLVNSIP